MNIFRRNNVDSIVKSFNKTIDRLDRAAAVHTWRSDKFAAIADEARKSAETAIQEANRARVIRAKFEELLSA